MNKKADKLFNRWKNISRLVVFGNGPSLAKINLHAFSDEVTVGVNGILYNGFEPTFICITDHIIIETHPPEIIFGSKTSIYILRYDLYQRYQDVILRYISPQQVYTLTCQNVDILHDSVTHFDPLFNSFNVSYSVMIDLVFPLASFLRTCNIYMLGIDHSHFKNHSYDNFLVRPPIDPPNPQKIKNFNDITQADDLTRRYRKAKQILDKYGINVWNVGLDSRLDVFPKTDIVNIFPTSVKNIERLTDNDNRIFFWNVHRILHPFVFRIIPNTNTTTNNNKSNDYHLNGYFESLLNPEYRLRHCRGIASVEKYQPDRLFNQDSTFCVEHGLKSFQSENYHQCVFRSINKTHFFLQKEHSVTLIRPHRNVLQMLEKSNQQGFQKSELGDHWIFEASRLGRFYVSSESDPNRKFFVRFVSLQSPNHFLRHSNGKIKNQPFSEKKIFLHDSTFQLELEDFNIISLSDYLETPQVPLQVYIRSYNKPQFYLVNNGGNWIISRDRVKQTIYPYFEKMK